MAREEKIGTSKRRGIKAAQPNNSRTRGFGGSAGNAIDRSSRPNVAKRVSITITIAAVSLYRGAAAFFALSGQ